MGFKHSTGSDDPHAGKWEVCGHIVFKSPTGKAVLFDDGIGKKWLPLKSVTIIESGRGSVTVFMPEWLNKKAYLPEEKARDVA